MFAAAGFYTRLKDIYVFDYNRDQSESAAASAIEASSKRKQLIDELQDLTTYLQKGGRLHFCATIAFYWEPCTNPLSLSGHDLARAPHWLFHFYVTK